MRRQARFHYRRNPRRPERGAALVEAAFMLPMFVILFYASLYAHNLGFTYIQMNSNAREASWAYSMSNCGDTGDQDIEVRPQVDTGNTGDPTKVQPMPDNPSPQSGPALTGIVSSLETDVANIVGKVLPQNGSSATASTNLNWREPNLYNGAGTGILGAGTKKTPITQSVTVNCNTAPKNGGAVNTLVDAVKAL